MSQSTAETLLEVAAERERQDAKWGVQAHPDGTGGERWEVEAEAAKAVCFHKSRQGRLAWCHILEEEVKEAFAERDLDKLRAELVQVAAVAVAWVEDIDRRRSG